MQTIYEKMGGTYRQEGDYLLPNIEATKSPHIGIWGQRRLQYDDKLVLTYNYKDGTETLTLQELESVLSSNLTSMCPPFIEPEIRQSQVFSCI